MSTFLLDLRFLLIAGAAAVALSACSGIVGPPDAPPLYVLRPPVTPAGGGARVGWQLSVALPSASRRMSGCYRSPTTRKS